MIGADLDHRQSRRQRSAGHDVLRSDLLLLVVKIDEVAGEHVDGADGETDCLVVDDRKVDEVVQGLFERCAIAIARRALRSPVKLSHGLVERGVKKPGCPPTMVIHELVAFRALRNTSPSGV